MTTKRLGIAAAVLVLDTVLLLIVGAEMWADPSSPADEAVGKGLAALGAALGIAAFVMSCAFLDSRARVTSAHERARSDWDTV